MSSLEAKRLFLKLFAGFLLLTAVLAIFSVLRGEFGQFQVKVLITTFSISAASICSMSCAAFIEKRKQKGLGFLGIVLSIQAAAFACGGFWMGVSNGNYWRTTITLVVVSAGFAHAFLLSLPDLEPKYRWAQKVAAGLIAVLAIQIIVSFWGEIENENHYRFLAAVSILVVLMTLVVPILMKMGGVPVERMVLTKRPDGTFVDEAGETYRVAKVEDHSGRT